jgi:hypothetical protein
MQQSQATLGPIALTANTAARPRRAVRDGVPFALMLLVLVAVPLPYLLRFDAEHTVTALVLGAVLCGLAVYSRRGAAIAALVLLAVLGDYRRYIGFFEGYPMSDPLLLVGPAAGAFLLGLALLEGRVRLTTWLARSIAALMLVMTVEIFNPLQGGLTVGFAGALFYLAPLTWFWVGRAYATREFMQVLTFRVLIAIGVCAALLGLYQTFYGWLSFERLWAQEIGYGALHISDEVIRAIGFFNSSAEYQRCLLVTAAVALAAGLARRSWLVCLVPPLAVMIFLAAARGPVIMLAGTSVLLWAVTARSRAAWLPRFAIAAALAVGALFVVFTTLQATKFGARIAPLVTRQVEGLLDPANTEVSTATGHLQMLVDGLEAGIVTPAGRGLGASTLAADKYGSQKINSEVDFSNIVLSLGIVGGVLYAAIIALVLIGALRWWRIDRGPLALATLGIVAVTFGAWLIGGEYSIAAFIWFYVGAMDKLAAEARRDRGRRRADRADHA